MFNGMLSNLRFFYKQYLSTSPDQTTNTNIKTLLTMSKGFLIIGALTSMSFTIPTIYSLLISIFDPTTSMILTGIGSVMLFFLIDLSIGSITPFTLDYTLSNKISNNTYSMGGGVLLWCIILFLGFSSMYLTWNGASIPVISSLTQPVNTDLIELEREKQSSIELEEKRYKGLVTKSIKDDQQQLKKLKDHHHNIIIKQTKFSRKEKSIQDSITKVNDFLSTQKSAYYEREMSLAIDNTRNSWNSIITEKKEQFNRDLNKYETRVSVTMLIVQILGSGSTIIFFLIQFVVTLLKYGEDPKTTPKPIIRKETEPVKLNKFKSNFGKPFDEMENPFTT